MNARLGISHTNDTLTLPTGGYDNSPSQELCLIVVSISQISNQIIKQSKIPSASFFTTILQKISYM